MPRLDDEKSIVRCLSPLPLSLSNRIVHLTDQHGTDIGAPRRRDSSPVIIHLDSRPRHRFFLSIISVHLHQIRSRVIYEGEGEGFSMDRDGNEAG